MFGIEILDKEMQKATKENCDAVLKLKIKKKRARARA